MDAQGTRRTDNLTASQIVAHRNAKEPGMSDVPRTWFAEQEEAGEIEVDN